MENGNSDSNQHTETPIQPVTSPHIESRMSPSSHSLNKLFVIFGVVIILLFVLTGVGAYYLGAKKNEPIQTEKRSQELTSLSPTSKPVQLDPTANWKTYTSNEAHFSFKYPPTWSFIPSSEGCGPVFMSPNKKFWLTVCGPYINNYTAESAMNDIQSSSFKVVDQQNIVIDNHFGIRQDRSSLASDPNGFRRETNIFLNDVLSSQYSKAKGPLGIHFYIVEEMEVESSLNDFNQILSTFKFTE